MLSYVALVVGAFLIYNTISVSVVRRRAEIGIARALGASRTQVLVAFLGEAAFFGIAGVLLGVPLGRLLASAAVKLMATTVACFTSAAVRAPLHALQGRWRSRYLSAPG